MYNFILNNGAEGHQTEGPGAPFSFGRNLMPEDADNKIRSVDIYHHKNIHIVGFRFFDKDHKLIFMVVNHEEYNRFAKETVKLEENEVIIGFLCKIESQYGGSYTDF